MDVNAFIVQSLTAELQIVLLFNSIPVSFRYSPAYKPHHHFQIAYHTPCLHPLSLYVLNAVGLRHKYYGCYIIKTDGDSESVK